MEAPALFLGIAIGVLSEWFVERAFDLVFSACDALLGSLSEREIAAGFELYLLNTGEWLASK